MMKSARKWMVRASRATEACAASVASCVIDDARRGLLIIAIGCAVGCSLLTPLDDLRSGEPIDAASEPLPPPTPAPCDPSIEPASSGVFASLTGDDALAGTAEAPVKTIARALVLAKEQSATDVYLDEGTYAEDVAIASATTVHGGWKANGATWSHDCATGVVGRTVVRSPTARAVTATGFGGASGLDTITLVTIAKADANASAIAVLVSGAMTFRMTGVDVTAGSGGDGAAPPIPPPAANTTCTGSDPGQGQSGAVGSSGAPAIAGTFNATGFTTSIGAAGANGSAGENGTAGGDGEALTGCK